MHNGKLRLPPLKKRCILGENSDLYPSSKWRSHNKSAYTREYRARTPQEPKPPFKQSTSNSPQGTHAYHIWKIDHKPVCDVKSRLHEPHFEISIPRTEAQSKYEKKALFPKFTLDNSPRNLPPARGIIPGEGLYKDFTERMLPAVPRETSNKMSSMPLLQYSGKKLKVGAPYKDGGIIYDESSTKPVPAHKDNYWHSVSSLTGNDFSRRKNVYGPNDALPVKGFDGGAENIDRKDGIRCGYKNAYSTGVRECTVFARTS